MRLARDMASPSNDVVLCRDTNKRKRCRSGSLPAMHRGRHIHLPLSSPVAPPHDVLPTVTAGMDRDRHLRELPTDRAGLYAKLRDTGSFPESRFASLDAVADLAE